MIAPPLGPDMRIVLGVGGAADAMTAVRETIERTAETGDTLTIAILENPGSDRTIEEIETAVREELTKNEVDAEIVTLQGDPGPALTTFAADGDYDRIVLGGGERSPMGKIAMGDIAQFVILNADRTVTLIR